LVNFNMTVHRNGEIIMGNRISIGIGLFQKKPTPRSINGKHTDLCACLLHHVGDYFCWLTNESLKFHAQNSSQFHVKTDSIHW
ncbi:MAG: hypothetical protein KDE51_00845, partial [Anaerolineales bacterium]|nr:hypothetical protein [Anaerolineales bacterium]